MDDSDDEYVDSYAADSVQPRRKHPRRKRDGKSSGDAGADAQPQGYAWEDEYHRSWDVVQEDSGGSLAGMVAGMVEQAKRKRVLHDTRPVQRGIIRNIVLILDMSFAMADVDMRPNRLQVMLNYAIEFVNEYFNQNPISQLAIVCMRDGIAALVSPLDGNPNVHIDNIQALRKQYGTGVPSLQNALEMAKVILMHVPPHCTKEVLLIFGALMSSDPGDINKTISDLVLSKIRVRIIGLAAQVAVCQRLTAETNFGDKSMYNVVLNEAHFRDLFLESTTPLSINKLAARSQSACVEMGFASRVNEARPSLCACHGRLTKRSFTCPRCLAKVCSLPMVCPCCQLTLILSTHLARSYHHLFPLENFERAPKLDSVGTCFGCMTPLEHAYGCPKCHNSFCIDCDVYCHESLHNCPGCEAITT